MDYKDKKLEAMLERLMRDEAIENPSVDFTDKVMRRVHTLSTESNITYQPLISKRVWLLIALLFAVLVTYIFMNSSGGGSDWMSHLNMSDFHFKPFENIYFEWSKTLSYGSVLFGIMLLVQATVLKFYFNNRMSI